MANLPDVTTLPNPAGSSVGSAGVSTLPNPTGPDLNNIWQVELLKGLGYPVTPQNLALLNDWHQAEGGSAANNPLNTTQPGPGASDYNSVGVKNYPSADVGLAATIATLKNGRYANILRDLAASASPQQTAQDVAASPWGTGSLIERIAGGGGSGATLPPTQAPSPATLPSPDSPSGAMGAIDSGNIMSLIQQLGAKQGGGQQPLTVPGQAPQPGSGTAPPVINVPVSGGNDGTSPMRVGGVNHLYPNISFSPHVDWGHVNPALLQAINKQAQKLGVTATVVSGYRDNAYSAANGGFAGDPHTKGLAVDAYINGHPIGEVIPPDQWSKLGITSGAHPDFYKGKPDPEHLQLTHIPFRGGKS